MRDGPTFESVLKAELLSEHFAQACQRADVTRSEMVMILADILMSMGGHDECPPDQPCKLKDPKIIAASEAVAKVMNESGIVLCDAFLIYGGMLGGIAKLLAEDDGPAFGPAPPPQRERVN